MIDDQPSSVTGEAPRFFQAGNSGKSHYDLAPAGESITTTCRFHLSPAWTCDDPTMRDDMQTVLDTLNKRRVEYTMNEMSTTLEGSLIEISEVIDACRQRIAAKHDRLLIQVTFDDDRANWHLRGKKEEMVAHR